MLAVHGRHAPGPKEPPMTAINMNFASPRLLLVAAGAVRQIADVLAKFGLSRPLVVTDPFMVSSGHVRNCLDPAGRRGHDSRRVQRHRARPHRHRDRGWRDRTEERRLRLPDRLRRRLPHRHREGDVDPGCRRQRRQDQDARLQGAFCRRQGRPAGHRHPDHRRHRQRMHALHRHHRHRTRRKNADRRPWRAAAGGLGGLRTDFLRAAPHHRRYRRRQL